LVFQDGDIRVFDMTPYLDTGIFRELRSAEVFETARVHFGTVEWQNGADFDPESLYIEGKKISHPL
jgi:hypothetical protein